MKKISEGIFYDVYDLSNGRVLKKKRSFFAMARSIAGKNKIGPLSLCLKTMRYIARCKRATSFVRNKMSYISQELIGNPKFFNTTDYEQDKVLLLMDYWAVHSLEENKKAVDQYVDLILQFLKYGMHDYVYKFKNSYGFNERGVLVFIDFNEVTFSKKETLELVKKNHWRTEAQFRKCEEGELKNYIEKKLEEALIPQNVEMLWGKLK